MTNFERTGGQTAHSSSYSHQKQGVQTLWELWGKEVLVENSSADPMHNDWN